VPDMRCAKARHGFSRPSISCHQMEVLNGMKKQRAADLLGAQALLTATLMLKRLPVIRHIRWLIWSWRVERHHAMWRELSRIAQLDQRTAPPGPMSALGGSRRAAHKEEVRV
jgi:hypothetical protein